MTSPPTRSATASSWPARPVKWALDTQKAKGVARSPDTPRKVAQLDSGSSGIAAERRNAVEKERTKTRFTHRLGFVLGGPARRHRRRIRLVPCRRAVACRPWPNVTVRLRKSLAANDKPGLGPLTRPVPQSRIPRASAPKVRLASHDAPPVKSFGSAPRADSAPKSTVPSKLEAPRRPPAGQRHLGGAGRPVTTRSTARSSRCVRAGRVRSPVTPLALRPRGTWRDHRRNESRTHVPRSGCWTWCPSHQEGASPEAPEWRQLFRERVRRVGSTGAECSHTARVGRQPGRSQCQSQFLGSPGEVPRFAGGRPPRAACDRQRLRPRRAARCFGTSQHGRGGYRGARQRSWKGSEAHGSIGRLLGGNVGTAQRIRRWSKALRSRAWLRRTVRARPSRDGFRAASQIREQRREGNGHGDVELLSARGKLRRV